MCGRGIGVVCVVIEGGDVMRGGMLSAHGECVRIMNLVRDLA